MNPKALVPLAEGFEEIEAVTIVDILRRAGVDVITAGLSSGIVTGSHGIKIAADVLLSEVKAKSFDLIALPGGLPGTINLRECHRIIELVKEMYVAGKIVAALCAAPTVLYEAGILKGKKFTVHPSQADNIPFNASSLQVVVDGQIITGQAAGAAMKFAFKIVEKLYGPGKVNEINNSVLAELDV